MDIRKLEIAASIMLLAAAGSISAQTDAEQKEPVQPKVGDSAPVFTATSTDGKDMRLKMFRGKVVLLDFWATWCPPCREEIPNVKEVYKKFKDKDFAIIGVSCDREPAKLKEYVEQNGIEWPQIYDRDLPERIATQYGVKYIPSMFVISRDGKIAAVNVRGEELAPAIEKALQSPGPLEVGTMAPDFAVKGLDGKPISLKSLRGKVVLLDFWATWCPPCREEIPNVIASYNKFKGKNFAIVGLSLDKEEAKLKEFIKTKGIKWPQYFDGQWWNNKIAQLYQVQSIPSTFLIDKEGKIIAKGVRGETLAPSIEKALKGK